MRRPTGIAHKGIWLLAVALGMLLPAVAQAAPKTYVPNRTGDHAPNGCSASDCTLREAVIAANAHAGHDTIKLGAKTYTLAIPGTGEDAAANGDLDLTQGVTIVGRGPSKTIVDGGGSSVGEAAFEVIAGGAQLAGITVRNSRSSSGDAGITLRQGSSLHMSSARVVQNVVTSGGGNAGIQAYDGTGADITLRHVVVSGNSGGFCCAGVDTDASAILSHVTVAHNTSPDCCNGINAGGQKPGSGGRACDRHDQRGVKRPQGPRCDIGAYERKRHRRHHHH